MRVLNEKDADNSFKFDRIIIRASGNAIKKAIMLVEDIKTKHGNLHQQNNLQLLELVDVYEPLYIGLETQKIER